ncbi:MAG TPA: Rne/Rng family ribonuclease [Holophagaceae bacterium]|nr:Rne/Rng family ribonuclease [Holophagaceae bacterium]
MNKKVMLINATDPEEIRVATLVEGVLFDYDVEFIHNEKIKGNIYKARVVRVDQALQAAFIHYGGQKNGFLPLGELPRDMVSPEGRRGRIQDLLHKDQEIMVQAVREELGSKGAMMTAQLSMAGRYLVITPGNPVNGISRKIEGNEERKHFKALIDELEIPKDIGVIVRTASLGVTKEDFQRDLEYLLDMHKEVLARYKHKQGPGLVWQEDDVVTRTLRDSWTPEIDEVHIDDLDTFHAATTFFRRTMPQHAGVLRHYTGKKPLFSKFQTEEQIDRVYGRKVPLTSGGALVLDQTEALVAIDVNSGKTSGENQEDTAYKTNMEAAEEVARQLRLRDLAGLVVIDFIDMRRESHIKHVQDKLVDCLKADKARMEVGKINRFGVLVMTRQRIRPSLQHVNHETCAACQGTGKIKTLEAMVLSVLRRVKAIVSRGDVGEIRIKLAPAIATAVLNQKRRELAELEDRGELRILISADPSMGYGEMAAEIERADEEREPQAEAAPKPKPERHRREEETVVLGGDSPISFEKALGTEEPREKKADAFKYDRRDAQKAALDERERLRALFESAKPEDEEEEEGAEEGEASEDAKAEGGKRKRRRRRRGGKGRGEGTLESGTGEAGEDSAAAAPLADATPAPKTRPAKTSKAAAGAEAPAPKPESTRPKPRPVKLSELPEPPQLTADIVASLITPALRPKKLAAKVEAAPAPDVKTEAEAKPEAKKSARAKKAPEAEVKPVADATLPEKKPRAKKADNVPAEEGAAAPEKKKASRAKAVKA